MKATSNSALRSIGSNWGITVLTIISTFVTVPLMLRYLGNDLYGRWLLISSLNGYLSLVMLGAPMASVRQFSRALASGDDALLARTLTTVTSLFTGFAAVALVGSLGLLGVFLSGYETPEAVRPDAVRAFLLLAASSALSFLMLIPVGFLSACDRFVEKNLAAALGVAARLAGYVLLLRVAPRMTTVAAVTFLAVLTEFVAVTAIATRQVPALQLRLGKPDRAILRELLTFSAFVLVLQAASQLSFQTDALVIGRTLNVSLIPAYNVANSLNTYVLQFVIGIAAVIMPRAARYFQSGDRSALRELFERWGTLGTTVGVVAAVGLFVTGPDFINAWVGSMLGAEAAMPIRILALSAAFFLPARGVALPLLMGVGDAKVPTLAFLGAAIVNVALSVALSSHLGLTGIALGTAIPSGLVAIFLIHRAARAAEIGAAQFFRTRVIPQIVVGALVLVLSSRLHEYLNVHGYFGVAVNALLILLMIGAGLFITTYRRDPALAAVANRLNRLIGR